ncbi:unnamed protein product [Protopolystoma xenopodis]|uniref:Uncharacterized protein n=1 Tax=Protopolystoma xenopodis TaxID=117903 RepID=A0A3S5CIX9_9PLAT|nr:unnamed protein product [Protopolystoma xenopodis]
MGILFVQHTYRDAKLWPGGSRAWDWRETGTGHLPGIQIADIVELLLTDPTHIVLSRGVLGVLQVPQATIDHIKAHPSVQELIIERSYAARNTYNALVSAGHRVAGLIHTTC